MAGGVHLVAIDDLDLTTLNLYERPLVTADGSTALEWGTRRRDANQGSAFVAGTVQTAIWNVLFKCEDYETHDALLSLLSGEDLAERRLLAQRDDEANTEVVCWAAILRITLINELDFAVQFEAPDSTWRSAAPSVTSKTFSTGNDRALRVTVPGNTATRPRIIVRPTAQRSGSSIYAGWRYRKRYVISWDGDVPLVREPIRIALGSTTALVSGSKAQADGDDVRFWLDGIEQPRTLVTWNTSASYAWVIVPLLLPGESLTFEMTYGNPSATNPPELDYPDRPAFDLTTSTNASLLWPANRTQLANAGLGIWHLFATTDPTAPDYGIPGAWRPARTINNPDSKDLCKQQPSLAGTGALAGYELAGFNAERAPSDQEGNSIFDTNIYDGIEFYSPLPITVMRMGYTVYNPGLQGSVRILSRLSSAHLWGDVYRDATNGNVSATDVSPLNTTLPTPSMHIAVALWPANGWVMNEDQGGYVSAKVYQEWTVTRDDSALSITTSPAEEEIYEFATELAVGGGESWVPPYRALLLGNARQETGKGTPRLACTLSQTLVLDCETGAAEIWSVSGGERVALVEPISAHVVTPVVGWDNLGDAEESPSSDWLSVQPTRKSIANGDFAASINGWHVDTTPAGMTAAVSQDPAVGGAVLGSLKMAITPSTAASGQRLILRGDHLFRLFGQESVDLAAWCISSNANLAPGLGVRWYRDEDGTSAISDAYDAAWTPTASAEQERAVSFAAPSNARSYRVLLLVTTGASSQTGNLWFDDVRFGERDILVRDEAIGQLAITVEASGVWL